MRNNSDFSRGKRRGVNSQKKIFEPIKKPIQKDEILGVKPLWTIPGLYTLNKKTNALEPKVIPQGKCSLVVVEKGPCPKEQEQNVICDDVEYFEDMQYKVWVPYYKFYVGQFVSFWTKQTVYTFQIVPNDDKRFGEFRLIEKRAVVRQPGKDTRTSKTKGI